MEMISSKRYRVFGYIGGKGSGKTIFGGSFAGIMASQSRAPGMIVAPTSPLLHRVALLEFERLMGGVGPRRFLVYKNENKRLYRTCNGNLIFWGSADRPQSLEGTTLGWWWIDESQDVEHAAYKNMVARLRHPDADNLIGLVTGTPIARTYLKREFDSGKPTRGYVRVSTRDNYLAPSDYVEELASSLNSYEADAFIDGNWLIPQDGRVYPEFSSAVHEIDYSPDPSLPVIGGLDFGFRYPAFVAAQVRNDGSVVVFDEIVTDNMSTEAMAISIASKFPPSGNLKLSWIAVDPAGASFSSSASEHGGWQDATSLRAELLKEGLDINVRYLRGKGTNVLRSLHTGISKVRRYLLDARGHTKLYFSKSLRESRSERGILTGMESYEYIEGTQKPLKGKMANQVDHSVDALRYMLRHMDLRGASVESYA